MKERQGRKRTRGSWAGARLCFPIEVKVDERVELLERERLRRLVVDKHTVPLLCGLLLAFEQDHFVALQNILSSVRTCAWAWGDGGVSAHIGCGTLDPDGSHLPTRVHLEGARLGGVYRCGLVVV